MYSNNILNFQESMTILNACTKKVWKLIESTTYVNLYLHMYIYVHIHAFMFIYVCTYMSNYLWMFLSINLLHTNHEYSCLNKCTILLFSIWSEMFLMFCIAKDGENFFQPANLFLCVHSTHRAHFLSCGVMLQF